MSTVAKAGRLLTVDDYWEQSDDRRTELVKGKVIEMSPAGFRHGRIQVRISRRLGDFVDERELGEVSVESGVVTSHDPDSVRGPDVMFYSWDRLPEGDMPVGFMDVPPEVAFEVLSPSQSLKELLEKADEYLAASVLWVGIVDPERRSVVVRQREETDVVLTEDGVLHPPAPLDEWNPRVGDFFPK